MQEVMCLRYFMQENKEEWIQKWINYIQTVYTDKLNETDLQRNANWYIPLILEIDIPLGIHEFFEKMFFVCRQHHQVDTSVTDFLKSFRYWRLLFITEIKEFIIRKQLPFESFSVLSTINDRIGHLQTIFIEYYINQCNQTIQKQEQTIQEFHEDRLNLLGKMAAGLRLSICRQIMSKNHGDLICNSFEKETTFTMVFAKEGIVSCYIQKTDIEDTTL